MSDQQELTRLQQQARANIEAFQRSQTYEAKRAAEQERQIAAFQRDARHAFPGTPEEFEAAWPRILADWKAKQAVEGAVAARGRRVKL